MSSKVGKRPSRQATTAEKVRAIQRVKNGEKKASVARAMNVPESTLRGWCKNEQRILEEHRKYLIPKDEIPNEPTPKKLKVDENRSSIQALLNASIKLAQSDSLTTADNKNENEICPQNLSTITVDNGRSTLEKEMSTPVGLSLLGQRPEVLLSQQISECHINNKNERCSSEINAHLPVSTSGQNKILGCQQANIYDSLKMYQGIPGFNEIYTASGSSGTSLTSNTTGMISNGDAALLQNLFLTRIHLEMICQNLSSSVNVNREPEPLLYQQLTKLEQLLVAKPVERPFELPKQVYAVNLSSHSRDNRNSDASGSPEQLFMSHNASPANSQASLSDSRTSSPAQMFPGMTTCVPMDMSTSRFGDCSMRYRENSNHYRETNHNNVSKKVVNTSSQSSSNGEKFHRKILKRKFEINNLLPENTRNKYLNGKINWKDSGFTSEDEDDFGSILAAGEKFLKWLERAKEKSVTHIQVNQVRQIVMRLRSKV